MVSLMLQQRDLRESRNHLKTRLSLRGSSNPHQHPPTMEYSQLRILLHIILQIILYLLHIQMEVSYPGLRLTPDT